MTVLYFLPLGGQKSEALNVPTTLSIPLHGLDVPDIKFLLASFTIPPSLHLTLPLFGSAEAHAELSCNLYDWETSFYLGNRTVDVPTYVAELKTVGQSPVKVLSYKFEGKHTECYHDFRNAQTGGKKTRTWIFSVRINADSIN